MKIVLFINLYLLCFYCNAIEINIAQFNDTNSLIKNESFDSKVNQVFNFDLLYSNKKASDFILSLMRRPSEIVVEDNKASYADSCQVGACDDYKVRSIQFSGRPLIFMLKTRSSVTVYYNGVLMIEEMDCIYDFLNRYSRIGNMSLDDKIFFVKESNLASN
ncbi:hypothetical protein [Shewanella surugensis]|uniref:DUF302 domain-containing protein n=1 Tax=Shewanella surugensis TaxID=212020 RepID=A0ABT0L5M5_9GAMM|nr:hypothetical protein [Shewanella surugensis]MCL1122983.1 hypothetical protein [Shewanella surugensis]